MPIVTSPTDALERLLHGSPYQAYTYSYPHKTAYRRLTDDLPLRQVWADENKTALFLYLHIPFCEHRCGFCNLFTQTNPVEGLTQKYLSQLAAEATHIRDALGPAATYAQMAIGGGTPTFLTTPELQQLVQITRDLGAESTRIPVSVEVSPATVDDEKLMLLKEFGTDRISIGIQSFDENEARRLGRPQKQADVINALKAIRNARFPILNIDLIYGGEGQSIEQWLHCVREALTWNPEELYLYPLYVRPLTGLGRLDRHWDDQRLQAYRAARDLLLESNYEQTSMRMFQRRTATLALDTNSDGGLYQCQADGMIGAGCGARSYTTSLHYSTEFAVGRRGVRAILADYVNRDAQTFERARHGYRLPLDDQRRRFTLMSLLQTTGMSRAAYQKRFGADVLEHLPQLSQLKQHDLASITDRQIQLTAAGMERSDAVGPWLYSPTVQELMDEYELV